MRALLLALLSGCAIVTDADLIERMDVDQDGFDAAQFGGTDCDDADPTVPGPRDFFVDADGDGFGSPAIVQACAPGPGIVENDDDCDDADATVAPDLTFYADVDGDGYGDPDAAARGCEAPVNHVDNALDCDDADATLNPDTPWYPDLDDDGYAGDGDAIAQCDPPDGYARSATDCDDANAAVNPAATERCNGIDDDCDTQVDDADDDVDPADAWWLHDGDGDGYGDPGDWLTTCDPPSDYVQDDTDCDDTDATVNPGATEVCDEGDDDCDGLIDADDPSLAHGTTYWLDTDGDGYGGASSTVACALPTNHVAVGGDCDDLDPYAFPGATEACNGEDDDCDGSPAADEADDDVDGWRVCDGDCDDADDNVNPGAVEVWYDGTDQDCAGDDDDDQDGDGYTSDAHGGDDCDDTDATVRPGAIEAWYDGIDQDCSGGSDYDRDGDGYDSDAYSGTDCDDANDLVSPGQPEDWYNGVDNDCSGGSDFDQDGDGHDAEAEGGDDCDDLDPDVLPGMVVDVPTDFPTIQAAVDAVCDGSTVQILPGTHTGTADLGGRDGLTLLGTGGSSVTFLDGDGSGPVIAAILSERDLLLEGLTIRNGASSSVGGGVHGQSASMTLRDVVLTGNSALSGGGLYASYGSVTLEDVAFTDNETSNGAALRIEHSSTVLRDVTFSGNLSASGISALRVEQSSSFVAERVTIEGGPTGSWAAAVYYSTVTMTDWWLHGNADALDLSSVEGTISGLLIEDNDGRGLRGAPLGKHTGGGTLLIEDLEIARSAGQALNTISNGTTTIRNARVHDNAQGVSCGAGTGSERWENVAVYGNGTGVQINTSSSAEVTWVNGLAVGNGTDGFHATAVWKDQITLTNVISAFNDGYGLYVPSTSAYLPAVTYGDVYGNLTGAYDGITDPTGTLGNLAVDPAFVSWSSTTDPSTWDLHLSSSSPLIDAGDPSLLDPNGTRSDMGAYGGPEALP